MKLIYALIICQFLYVTSVSAEPYEVDMDNSHINFSGEHAGNEFKGTFNEWSAEIDFDEQDLENSKALITIKGDSALTGNKMYDSALPKDDWFNVDDYPQIVFDVTDIKKTDNENYDVTGDLTIRNITHSEIIPATLTGDDIKILTAEFPIDRLKYDIGNSSDPDAEWVGKDIVLNIQIQAKPIE